MKKIALSFVALICAVACFAQNCTIKGHMNVPDFQNKEVSLVNAATGNLLAKSVIQDEYFTFEVPAEEPFWGKIMTAQDNGGNYYFLDVVVEPGVVSCDLVTDELAGTPTNEQYYKFAKDMKYEESVWYALADKFESATTLPEDQMISLASDMQTQVDKMVGLAKHNFMDNKDNLVGTMAFNYLVDLGMLSYEELQNLLAEAAPCVRNYPPLVLKMSQMEKLIQTAVGKQYVDLDVKDFKTGKTVKLSKYIKGKIALIDFWASWCRPCRAEIPNIAKIYEKYGNEIVVISLNVWDKPEPQAKAIKDLNMNWVQLTDNTMVSTDTYGIEGIPHIMLIGKDGKILARDLRGEDIETAVKNALK